MKTFKKLLTILTIFLVAFTAFMPVSFAAEGDLTIEVTGEVGGRTLSVYKLFNIEVEAGTNIHRYSWDGLASQKFFASKGYETVAKATDYLKGFEDNVTELTQLAKEYYDFCNDPANATLLTGLTSEVVESVAIPADATEHTFTVNGKGYYLIYDETVATIDPETGIATPVIAAAMLQNVVGNMENVTLKAKTPTVDKTVDTQTAYVGDKVNFEVKSQIPNVIGYDEFYYVVTDILTKGLTFGNDVKVTIDGVEYPATINEGTIEQYKVEYNKDATTGKTTVTITFNSEEFLKLQDKMDKEIKITYSATLNEDAAVEVENSNEVSIEYSNDPETDEHGKTNTDIVYVYTYGLDFTKINSANKALNGATFVLKLGENKYAKFDANGVYDGICEFDGEDLTQLPAEAKLTSSGEDEGEALGLFSVSGLKAGNYELIEIVAPDGYNLPNFGFTFEIKQTLDEDGKLKSVSFDYTADANNNSAVGYMTDINKDVAKNDDVSTVVFEVNVLNAKEGELPTTGGIGTTIFTIAGIAVMAIAGIALFMRNRKND